MASQAGTHDEQPTNPSKPRTHAPPPCPQNSPRSWGDPKRASFSPAPSSSAFSSASSSMGDPPDSPRSPRSGKKKAKTFSSRCWLARHYPISLAHVIPLLEVVAAGNKHFAQVGREMGSRRPWVGMNIAHGLGLGADVAGMEACHVSWLQHCAEFPPPPFACRRRPTCGSLRILRRRSR